MNFELFRAECPKCKHNWILRTKEPRLCPKCKKRLWTTSRKFEKVSVAKYAV